MTTSPDRHGGHPGDCGPPRWSRRHWLAHGLLRATAGPVAIAGAAALLAAPRSARAGYNFWLGEYTLGKPELEAQLARHFPLRLRYAELFTVTLTNPVLGLDAPANRARVTSEMQIDNPLFLRQPARGVLAVSSGLRYDAPARALRLHEARAERVELAGLNGDAARQLQAVAAAVAAEALRDYALYTFRPEELVFKGQTLTPGAITVLDDGIKVKVDLG
ncbi:MAG: DUF1439 domain-containing protein [Comamonas sp.]